eukprot:UN06618
MTISSSFKFCFFSFAFFFLIFDFDVVRFAPTVFVFFLFSSFQFI